MRVCSKKTSICLSLLVATYMAGAAELPPDVERFASPPPGADEVLLQLSDPLGNAPRTVWTFPASG